MDAYTGSMSTTAPEDGAASVTAASPPTPASDAANATGSSVSGPSRTTWRARWNGWRGDDDTDALVGLVVLGVFIEIFLVVLVARFPLTKFYPGPGVSLGFPQMMSGSWDRDFRWLAIVLAVPFAAFVPALWLARNLRSRAAVAIVFGFAVLFGLTLIRLYPITAADLFHYLADARTLWVYHQNPMQVPPQNHPFVIGISWAQQPSPYGPFWQLLSIIPVMFTGDHWAASIYGLKLLSMAFYLAAGALVFLTVRRTWPGRELLATMVFAWNPFVVFRTIGNGHNDVVMMAFALSAFYFVSRGNWLLALPLLALSVCIKYSTALIVPPVLLYAWMTAGRENRRELIQGAGIAAAVTLLVFVPFWRGFDTFKTFVQNANMTITSVPQLVSLELQPARAPEDADHLVRQIGFLLFFLTYAGMLAGLYFRPSFRTLIAVSSLAFIGYLVLDTWWFRPWYFIWFLSLSALLPSFWWTALAVAASFGATFFDLIEQYRSHWDWVWSDSFRGYAAPVVAAFLPLLLLLVLGLAISGAWTMLRDPVRHESSA